MKVKAMTSFAGAVCMTAGESRDISDKALVKDLISAGYVESMEAEEKEAVPPEGDEEKDGEPPKKEEPAEDKPPKRSVKKDEAKSDHNG